MDIILSVDEELTGSSVNNEVAITIFGGEVTATYEDSEERIIASLMIDSNTFAVGKKFLLVLEKGSEGGALEGKYVIAGIWQGIFEYGEEGKVYNTKYFPDGESEDRLTARIAGSRGTQR